MKRTRRNEVGVLELFGFAKEHFALHWNASCAVFEDTEVIPFVGVKDFELDECEAKVAECIKFGDKYHEQKGYEIVVAFMKKHKIKRFRFIGDGN